LLLFLLLPVLQSISLASGSNLPGKSQLPDAGASKLPRWRGFNLLDKFNTAYGKPYKESDFKLISELGFNFVRLPMDYRCWIKNNDWSQINETVLKDIDKAVQWGRKYKIHVNLNFHRAPGYCVNPPEEPLSIWTDSKAQEACARHWAMFAKRYKGIPNSELSFNLINEPGDIDGKIYSKVVRLLTDAIHKEDPGRLVIADGIAWASKPAEDLAGTGVAQSFHNYQPFEITHYKASWINDADKMPLPRWPIPVITNHLYGPYKPEYAGPMVINGDFMEQSRLKIRVQVVSSMARLKIKADGKVIFDKKLVSGPGKGEWKQEVYVKQWDIYQNIFDKDYTAVIPSGTRKVELEVVEGDWMTFSAIEIIIGASDKNRHINISPTKSDWGIKPCKLSIDEKNGKLTVKSDTEMGIDYIKGRFMEPWRLLAAKNTGVMVGEWGVHNRTPHEVTLSWMQDCLREFRENGWGWALWNFSGSFGIVNSDRADVKYEDYKGYKLDRKMLELLQKY